MKLIYLKILKSIIIIFICLLISSLIINLLYYFDVLNYNIVKYFKLSFTVLSFFVGGIYMGKNSPNKGYLYGLKLSLFVILLFIIFGIIFNNFDITRIIFYIITTICITFGSMLGINNKRT